MATRVANIGFGDMEREPARGEIEMSARGAGADVVIDKLPEGYQTILGLLARTGTPGLPDSHAVEPEGSPVGRRSRIEGPVDHANHSSLLCTEICREPIDSVPCNVFATVAATLR